MTYFNLFSNIQIVKGISRVLISDLQRNVSEIMPLEFSYLIEELKTNTIEAVFKFYDADSKIIMQEYLDFLLEKEYGFITENDWDKNFPPLSIDYQDYTKISNIFIELNEISVLERLISSIENLGIKHLVIFSTKHFFIEDFVKIDEYFTTSVLAGIEIFSPFHSQINKEFIQNLNLNTQRIYNLVFHNCTKHPFKVKDEFRFVINFVQENIKITSCGKVDLKYFNTNLPKVLEAINHNSCLHKKIGIDIEGNIKNCPAMPQSFGNIKDTTLEEALKHKDFKKYWNLTKDNIEVCKDCEFRYICTDCRAYTERTHENKEGLDTSKPLKCGYDPYTGEWEEWSTNPLKEKAINFYGMQNLVKK
ncbi:grasp-with-spasm system SPASM domain peptide maturase [Chryseobacterium gotjawalense]|uniref:Grasp-with-spasm system SPASM domain peptide maturase n=1 Tax=Chryseobacterium gotjawalense TaxID=3042315 RepID=A0ABY8RDY7_9FLAO|nr:grasp-with-spasm system SPASM domain peptide maturase [Chryseobacterium sp. wdc7]WHF51919.1 grasp-with-spasm system SPASM domain peptide maturase [Chryseobacterium sp. wdc7]